MILIIFSARVHQLVHYDTKCNSRHHNHYAPATVPYLVQQEPDTLHAMLCQTPEKRTVPELLPQPHLQILLEAGQSLDQCP